MSEQVEVILKFSSIAAMVETLGRLNSPFTPAPPASAQDESGPKVTAPPEATTGFAQVLDGAASAPQSVATSTDAAVTLPAAAPTAGRRGRKPKAEAPAASPVPPAAEPAPVATALFSDPLPATPAPPIAPVAEAATSGTPASGSPSIDDCRAALGKVNEKHGMNIAYGMLQGVGAERVSLVPEDKRAQFIAACEAKAAEEAKAAA